MSLSRFNPRTTALLLIIIITAGLRLMINSSLQFNPLATFTPIAAMALFGGAYFRGAVKPFMFPLLALFISDVILSFTVLAPYRSGLLYSGWYWVYAAFALMSITGKYLLKNITLKNSMAALFTVTLIHWVISDFGVWLQGSMYPLTAIGYWECMAAAIPYELRFIAGTAVYGAIMFGSFEWMQLRYPQLKKSRINN